jgi:small-conductance mechanosensitive channel
LHGAAAAVPVAAPAPAAAPAADGGAPAEPPQEGLLPAIRSALGPDPMADPNTFPAPDPRARQLLGYASPWTPLFFVASLVLLAALVNRIAPKKKRRIRRATILLMLYTTAFALAVGLHFIHAEGWSRRVWFLADLFEVLMVINLTAIFVFDLLLLALHIELADIAHDLLLGAAYLLAFIGMLHRSGVNLSGIVATSAVVTAVLGLSLQATLANVLGGIALQIDKSISVGDWIQLQGGQQGKVKAIRWRSTLLETRNWDTVVVPNSALLGEHITVLGQREDQPRQHRMWVYFHIDYRFSPDEVIRVVDEALQAAPITNVAQTPQAHAICTDFTDPQGTDGVAAYAVRYWLTDLAKDDPTSSDVRVRIFTALKRAQIPLALPAHAVFVQQDDKERAERKQQQEMARRVSALEAIEMLQCLSTEERLALARSMRFAPFGRGEVMTRQGAQAHWLYVLIRGEAEVRVTLPGKPGEPPLEKLVSRLAAPNVFGEMGVMTGEPRTASVLASTEVECYRIDRESFHGLIKRRPELAEAISGVMARRRVELQTVRDGLDQEQKGRRVQQERHKVLAEIQSFFGLKEEE